MNPELVGWLQPVGEAFIAVAHQRAVEVFALLSEQPVAEARGVSE